MTTQLPERLRALADEAPGSLSGPDLWQAGRRRQRARALTALTVAGALVLAVVLAGYGDARSRRPDPAAPPATNSGPMAIPDRFFTPSPWLPTTSNPGRLVAVLTGVTQKHAVGGPGEGVVGVAAGSQRYTFLDLPGQNTDWFPGTVALAPDGLHLAYVINGSVPDSPQKESDAVGIAVLDLVTGRTERHNISGRLGFNNVELRWASPSVLLTAAVWPPRNFRREHLHGMFSALTRFTVGSASGEPIPPQSLSGPTVSVASGSEYGAQGGPHSVELRASDTGRVVSSFSAPRWSGENDGAVDSSGRRFATLRGTGFHQRVMWGRVVDGQARLQDIPGRVNDVAGPISKQPGGFNSSVIAWSDPHHLVMGRVLYPGRGVWALVDVRDGSTRTVVRHPGPALVAADAFVGAQVVPAVAPPRPWNRRAG